MPAVGLFAPEAGVPDEYLLLDGSEHDENQPKGGKLSQDARGNSQCASDLADPKENREANGHSDALGTSCRVFQVVVAAGCKDQTDHEPKEEKAEISETSELRKHENLRKRGKNSAPQLLRLCR